MSDHVQVLGHRRTVTWHRIADDVLQQVRELKFHIAALIALALLPLGGVLGIARFKHIPVSLLTRDPPATLHYHSYTGALSYLGILLWASSAAICLFTAGVVGEGNDFRFFLSAGLFSSLLTLDDLYLIHDNLPFQFGTPSWLDAPFYAALLGTFLYLNREQIFRSKYVLLAAAMAFLAASLMIDIVADLGSIGEVENFCEDGLKFVGIVFWLAYFARTASFEMQERIGSRLKT